MMEYREVKHTKGSKDKYNDTPEDTTINIADNVKREEKRFPLLLNKPIPLLTAVSDKTIKSKSYKVLYPKQQTGTPSPPFPRTAE